MTRVLFLVGALVLCLLPLAPAGLAVCSPGPQSSVLTAWVCVTPDVGAGDAEIDGRVAVRTPQRCVETPSDSPEPIPAGQRLACPPSVRAGADF